MGDELTPKQAEFVRQYLIDADRFWSYVDRSVGDGECWQWTGDRDSLGYGRFHIGKTRNSTALAHRLAYGIATGDSPEAVCHTCDNPSCCNPAHLFGGTRDENNKDMCKKGRHWSQTGSYKAPSGADHHHTKLSDSDVLNIRKAYQDEGKTQDALALMFGVSQRTICKVVNRIGYAYV